MRALVLAMRTRESGLWIGGPPCGSWVFLNCGTHRRHENIWGDERRQYVRDNNTFQGFKTQKLFQNKSVALQESCLFLLKSQASGKMGHYTIDRSLSLCDDLL